MNNDLLYKEKRLLTPVREIQEHHAILLKQHLEPMRLEEQNEEIHLQTAFPTPNHTYKQKINNTVLYKNEQELSKKE